MSSTQTRELTVSQGSGSTYLSKGGDTTLDGTVGSFKYTAGVALGQSGTATYNNAAKNILFPNSTAHPTKMEISYWDGAVGLGSPSAQFSVGGTQLVNQSMSTSKNNRSFTKTDAAVKNATKSTELKWTLKGATLAGGGIGDVKIKLSFTRYDFSATADDGIASASCDKSNGYEGDKVTFSASVKSGYTFDGWYKGSTKKSSSLTYEYTVNTTDGDMSLVAKTIALEQTDLYLKDSGVYKRIKAIYKKINGAYVKQADIPSLFPTGVKLKRE